MQKIQTTAGQKLQLAKAEQMQMKKVKKIKYSEHGSSWKIHEKEFVGGR